MEKSFKTLGIVLRKREWRGADLLFSVYTREFGRIEVVATGVKKITSKLHGHLSSLGLVELVFVEGKNFNKLTHAFLVEKFDLKTGEDLSYWSAIAEIFLESFRTEEKNIIVWDILVGALKAILDSGDKEKKKFILNIFLIKIIITMGYELKLDNCVSCGNALATPYRFNFEERGFICRNCSRGEDLFIEKNFELLKKVRFDDKTKGLEILKPDNDKLFIFLRKYLSFCLDRKIKSLENI
jgi:DNA repair protein RecO (recombination protein O)